jgi:hypothetical protein
MNKKTLIALTVSFLICGTNSLFSADNQGPKTYPYKILDGSMEKLTKRLSCPSHYTLMGFEEQDNKVFMKMVTGDKKNTSVRYEELYAFGNHLISKEDWQTIKTVYGKTQGCLSKDQSFFFSITDNNMLPELFHITAIFVQDCKALKELFNQ